MRLTFNGMRRNPGPKETNMGVSIQINRTDANLVLINVKTILPTLLSVELIEKITFVSCIIIFVRLNAVELCNLETTEFFLIHFRCQWPIHNV